MTQFQQAIDNRHQYAREWRARTGRPVVGCFCTYVPEEVIYAAGMLPVRVLGSHEPQDVTERHIAGMFCPFCRDVLAQGLLGRYDYLDGIVTAQSCIHIRQAFESWQSHVPVSFSHFLYMPCRVEDRGAGDCLEAEIRELKAALESWSGQAISSASLEGAIEVYNTNRRLLRQVYELRRGESPPLSGAEAMEMVLSSMLMDKAEHNALLAETAAGLKERPGREPKARLMVLGSENDDIEIIRLIESLGSMVVIDDHCTGSRYFWNEVSLDGDPLASVARRYLERPPCPTKDVIERQRLRYVEELCRDYGVNGAVILQQKFCHPHEFELPALGNLFGAHHIPTLTLELDTTIPYGQLRTRIEAFLEMLS
jgi:benzoyl-CoA reductase subunit C